MLQAIAKIVISARKRLHLDVSTLARRVSVEARTLTALESGSPGVTTTELERIAGELELDPVALLLGRDAPRPRGSIFLRHQGDHQDFDYASARVLDDALDAGRALRALNGSLGCTPSPRPWAKAQLVRPGHAPAVEGYRLANELRRTLGVPSEPLSDVRELLEERFEVVVLVDNLGSTKMTAVSIRDASGAAAVVLNAKDARRRVNPQLSRVYLAHELCHILFDPSAGGLHIVVEREAPGPEALDTERAEQRAKAFAAELLMPRQALVAAYGAPRAVDSEDIACELVSNVRERFGTPWEIATNHLKNRGFLSEAAREALLRPRSHGAPTTGIGTRLPKTGAPSLAFVERARRAHVEGLITDGQARVALRLRVEQPLPWA